MLIGSAIAAALVVDFLCDRRRIADGSALLAGAIFACLIPLNAPWWIAAIGGAIAIEMGKHWFGGLGQNPFNPAAFSRVLLMSLLPAYFFSPHWAVDAMTSATPLAKEIDSIAPAMAVLFWGQQAGTLGEAMPLAILAGGAVLIVTRTIDWRIPLDAAWEQVGYNRAVQGNLDPIALLSEPETLREMTADVLQRAAGRAGHIFNLGHGILPQTPVEHAIALVDMVHELSQR